MNLLNASIPADMQTDDTLKKVIETPAWGNIIGNMAIS
jgi:hypothetical protein